MDSFKEKFYLRGASTLNLARNFLAPYIVIIIIFFQILRNAGQTVTKNAARKNHGQARTYALLGQSRLTFANPNASIAVKDHLKVCNSSCIKELELERDYYAYLDSIKNGDFSSVFRRVRIHTQRIQIVSANPYEKSKKMQIRQWIGWTSSSIRKPSFSSDHTKTAF